MTAQAVNPDSSRATDKTTDLDHFVAASEARLSQWHILHRLTQTLSGKDVKETHGYTASLG